MKRSRPDLTSWLNARGWTLFVGDGKWRKASFPGLYTPEQAFRAQTRVDRSGDHPNFDSEAAAAARDEAIDRIDRSVSAAWKEAALEAVRYVAMHRQEFTADAVWWVLEREGVAGPHDGRALGPVMQRAVREGWIAPADRFVKTDRVSRHNTEIRVWRSLIFGQAAPRTDPAEVVGHGR